MTAPPPIEPFANTRVRTVAWALAMWFAAMIVLSAFGVPIVLSVHTVYVVLLGWTLYQCARAGVNIREFIHAPAVDDLRRIWLVLPTVLVSVSFIVVLATVLHLSPSAMRDQQMEQAVRRGPASAEGILTIFSMVVAAPITEELVFRGIILRRWTYRWGIRRAALASSAVFALLHLDPPGAFLFALVMVHLYTRSGSLVVPMTAHAFNNAIVVFAMLGGRNSDTQASATPASLRAAIPGVVILGLVGLFALWSYFKRQPRLSEWRLPPLLPRATPAQ